MKKQSVIFCTSLTSFMLASVFITPVASANVTVDSTNSAQVVKSYTSAHDIRLLSVPTTASETISLTDMLPPTTYNGAIVSFPKEEGGFDKFTSDGTTWVGITDDATDTAPAVPTALSAGAPFELKMAAGDKTKASYLVSSTNEEQTDTFAPTGEGYHLIGIKNKVTRLQDIITPTVPAGEKVRVLVPTSETSYTFYYISQTGDNRTWTGMLPNVNISGLMTEQTVTDDIALNAGRSVWVYIPPAKATPAE